MARIDETAAPVAEKSVESSASAVEWASIFGGALAALGVTAILLTLGPGLGLTTVSPWSFNNPSPTTFGTVAAIWLVVTQWLSSAFGGYLAGRLRTKWVGIRTEEVFSVGGCSRASASGFCAARATNHQLPEEIILQDEAIIEATDRVDGVLRQ